MRATALFALAVTLLGGCLSTTKPLPQEHFSDWGSYSSEEQKAAALFYENGWLIGRKYAEGDFRLDLHRQVRRMEAVKLALVGLGLFSYGEDGGCSAPTSENKVFTQPPWAEHPHWSDVEGIAQCAVAHGFDLDNSVDPEEFLNKWRARWIVYQAQEAFYGEAYIPIELEDDLEEATRGFVLQLVSQGLPTLCAEDEDCAE